MMLCKADFEELFPDLFGPDKQDRAPRQEGGQSLPAYPASGLALAAREAENMRRIALESDTRR